jgi:hypothetical protein
LKVEEASEEVNLQKVKISIEPYHLDYVCGANDSNLRYFENKARIISVTVEQYKSPNPYLEVIGKAQAIEDFRILINTHLDYCDEFT